ALPLQTNVIKNYWRKSRWHKFVTILTAAVIFMTGCMYGIAEWYIHSERSQPLEQGVSFIPDYARGLGLNPEQTMDALTGIGVKSFRLVSYWNDIEPSPGHYDFSQLDWEFKKAEAAHAKVTLVVGLRQPRWPECHSPDWVNTGASAPRWQPQLETFMQKVIERYKDSPSLQQYQLENEYFLKGFGNCTNFDRQRLVSEYDLVRKTDPAHPVVIGRSNNSLGFPTGQPQPQEFSISVYKRVWDGNFSHRYLEYPQPAWFYGFLAGFQKIFLHKDMVIGELQAEAWPPRGQTIQQTSLAEQNKSLDATRLKGRFQYGRATGMRQMYLWGAEYWYYRKVKLNDPSLWNVAKQEFQQS
ncbi:MAG: beta-galactosidase, partial [Candidatus Saccharimonadales bacterium]